MQQEQSRYCMVSVTEKNGIEEFCARLVELGWQIISTGGTARVLHKAGIPVMDISDLILMGFLKIYEEISAVMGISPDMDAVREAATQIVGHPILGDRVKSLSRSPRIGCPTI